MSVYAAPMSPTSTKSGRFIDDTATPEHRTYATFQHLTGLLSLADMFSGVFGLIAAVIMWRVKAEESEFLDDHGRESVNFQISLILYFFAGSIAFGIFAAVFTVVTLGIGIPLLPLIAGLGAVFLALLRVVGSVMGAMAANRGEYFRYPMTIRFLTARKDKDGLDQLLS